jgi:hypothetical protein
MTDPIRRNDARIISDYVHEVCGQSFCLVNLHERCYDYSLFENQVLDFPFPDHCSPRLSLLESVVAAMEEARGRIPDITFFVHCKAGRGRSCAIAAAYLLFLGTFTNCDQAIADVNVKRSPQGLCISIPSQRRFLRYFELISHHMSPPSKQVRLISASFSPPLAQELDLVITHGIPFDDSPSAPIPFDGGHVAVNSLIVNNEFTISIHPRGGAEAIVRCQLHSSYFVAPIEKVTTDNDGTTRVRFEKHELDGPHHRRRGKTFPDGFSMTLLFEEAIVDSG